VAEMIASRACVRVVRQCPLGITHIFSSPKAGLAIPEGCLDYCKHGPNMEYGGQTYHHSTPRDADEIMAQFAG